MCIGFTNCEHFTEQDICNVCLALKNDNRFGNGVVCPTSKPENGKFIPKHYFKINALINHFQYTDVQ